jgi:hypothetical protein
MKSDKFFKWIWNFNGLVLFLGIVISTLFFSYQVIITFFKADRIERTTLNLAKDSKNEEKWRLGYPQKIKGTDFYYIPLQSEKLTVETRESAVENFNGRIAENFSGRRYNPTKSKNVMLINSTTNTRSWLFQSIDQLIIQIAPLTSGEYNSDPVALGMSYQVINSDTNQDNKLDNSDKRTFALSKVDGTNYTEIITGYNRIVEYDLNIEGNLFVVFINNDEVYSMVIDMTTFKVINKSSLPKVGDS